MKRRRDYSPFERRQRRASRLSLYGSLIGLMVVLPAALWYVDRVAWDLGKAYWEGYDFESYPEIRLFQRYLQIDTTHDKGDEREGARFLASVLEEAGIPAHVELLGDRHANVWAILEGRDPQALVLHNHIDTDPVSWPEHWEKPPFSGTIEQAWIYGRGAFDMKSVAIAQLTAFLDLAAGGRPLERSVIFLATGSEEVGSDLGMQWILRHHPELSRRFWGVLTEGGTIETRGDQGGRPDIKYWGIEVAQKRIVYLLLCSPERQPLDEIRKWILEQRAEHDFYFRLTPEVDTFLARYGPTRDRKLFRDLLADPAHLAYDGVGYFQLPVYLRSMFRDEILPYLVEESEGGGFELRMQLVLLPGSDPEGARQRLLPDWRISGLPLTVHDEHGADHGSPLDHPLYLAQVRALERAQPRAVVGPVFLPSTATDSRFTRAAGVPSYGFSPFIIPSADTLHMGRPNERFDLPAFLDGVAIYRGLVAELATGSPRGESLTDSGERR